MITVLKSTRGILRLTGLGTDSLIVFKKLKIPNRVIQIVIVFSQIYATLPYILYTSGNSYLLERIDNPAYAIVGYTGTVLIYIEFIRSHSNTNETITFLDTMVKKRIEIGDIETTEIFNKAEQYDTNFVHKIGKLIKFVYGTFIFQSGLGPILYIISGAPEPEKWFSQLQMKFPFKSYNGFGFFALWMSHSSATAIFMLLYLTVISLYIGLCRYVCALFYAFKSDVQKINRMGFNVYSAAWSKTRTHQKPLAIHMIPILQFHLEIFKLMDCVQHIMSGPFFRQLCTYAIFIGHSLNSQDIKEYTFDVIVGLYALAFQTMFNFVICYFADTVTYASLNVANILYDMNWFEFPIEEQKLILIMIQRAQIPFHFKGNDSIVCSLHSFLKIVKSTFFYYVFLKMVIRHNS